MRRRYGSIAIAIASMAACVLLAGSLLRSGHRTAAAPPALPIDTTPPLAEAEQFRLAPDALAYARSPEHKASPRTLQAFYARRAFPGAPPFIPHALDDDSIGGRSCLGCHADGGYVQPFKAYAPVTPHPAFENCRQCHVAGKAQPPPFRASLWERPNAPAIDREVLPGAPPPVPHDLAMRENCLACHAGPAAVAEIRTPHPERVNCRQCHALSTGTQAFVREVQ